MKEKRANQKVTIWTKGFICVMIANLTMGLAQFSVNTYVSTYMKYLGTGAVLTGLIAGLYFGVAFLMRPISGPAITILNKKKMMIIIYGSGIFINLAYAFFPSIGMFVFIRLMHGVQLAFYGSLALTVASESLPEEKMASGLGVYGLSMIFAQAFGPSIAVFVQNIGERLGGEGGGFMAIFLSAALFALIAVIPCFFLPDRQITKEERASLGAWYKNIVAKEAVLPSTVVMLLAMSYILFSTYMIPYGIMKNITNISLYFTISAAVTILVRPIAGKLTDHFGPAKIFYPSILIYAGAFLLLSYATDIKLVIVSAVCAALGLGAGMPAVQVMAIQSVEPIRRGVASNTNFLGMDLGSFLGPTISGFILARFSYEVMFRLAIIPIMLAIVVFMIGWKPYLRNRHTPQEHTSELIEDYLDVGLE